MSSTGQQTYRVLLADDSADDRFFLRKIVRRFPRLVLIHEVSDGEEAMAYLEGRDKYADRAKHPLPDLILLDLKMPRASGYDVLTWLRGRTIPRLTVVVMSDSPLKDDKGASLLLGAHGYWTKTADVDGQDVIAREIETLLDERWKSFAAST